MKHDLNGSPKVWQIEQATGLDSYAVIGRLHKVWSWADNQTDGGASPVTFAFIDRLIEHEGFAQAMANVGWLEQMDDGIFFPNFGDHNGQTAKRRAKESARKGQKRGSAQSVRKVSASHADKVRNTEQDRTEQNTTAPPPLAPSPQSQLANAAAAAAGVLTIESWEIIGRKAGLDRDLAGQCADAIVRCRVTDAEAGLVALERLSEAMTRQDVKTPIGLLKTMLASGSEPEPAKKTIARRRRTATQRADFLKAASGWPPGWGDQVYRLARDALPEGARPATPSDPPEAWGDLPDAMLDFIAANYSEITKPMMEKSA